MHLFQILKKLSPQRVHLTYMILQKKWTAYLLRRSSNMFRLIEVDASFECSDLQRMTQFFLLCSMN